MIYGDVTNAKDGMCDTELQIAHTTKYAHTVVKKPTRWGPVKPAKTNTNVQVARQPESHTNTHRRVEGAHSSSKKETGYGRSIQRTTLDIIQYSAMHGRGCGR